MSQIRLFYCILSEDVLRMSKMREQNYLLKDWIKNKEKGQDEMLSLGSAIYELFF